MEETHTGAKRYDGCQRTHTGPKKPVRKVAASSGDLLRQTVGYRGDISKR